MGLRYPVRITCRPDIGHSQMLVTLVEEAEQPVGRGRGVPWVPGEPWVRVGPVAPPSVVSRVVAGEKVARPVLNKNSRAGF